MTFIPMPKKPAATRTTSPPLEAQLVRLERQNANLRREIERLQAYRAMAYRDPLTGLWNRRFFDERVQEEISRSRRAGADRRFSVMVIDINGFKEINDQHGHQAGDGVLRWVAEFLIAHLRSHDVPCRTGGDEFMVLLPDLSAADSVPVVSRLRDQLGEANRERQIPVSLGLGCASWPENSKSCAQLLETADTAMYADKRRQKAAQGKAPRAALPRTTRSRLAAS